MNELIIKLYNLFLKRSTMTIGSRRHLTRSDMTAIKNDIINLSTELKNINPHYSTELFRLKDDLFLVNYYGYMFEPSSFTEVFTIIKALKYNIDNQKVVESNMQNINNKESKNKNKIFIVHGHNIAMQQSAARLVEKLNLQAIILSEQANRGNTLIKKFEENTDVSYAIVLCSADDKGYAKNLTAKSAKLRARQNVIFEMGYFIAKLGANNVAVVLEDDTNFEKPSDIAGVAYTNFDSDNKWWFDIIKELQAQNFTVSADSVL